MHERGGVNGTALHDVVRLLTSLDEKRICMGLSSRFVPLTSRVTAIQIAIRSPAMRTPPVQFDREKLKEAVWLIADYCPPEELGNVKLHKVLYFADMLFFLEEGRPITGVEYQKQKFGPTARHLTSALTSLQSEGVLRVEDRPHHGFYKKAYLSQRAYEPVRLTPAEIELLREVADFVRGKSAREISELSHNAVWEAAELGETLPYFTALRLIPDEITEDDRAWAIDSAERYATATAG